MRKIIAIFIGLWVTVLCSSCKDNLFKFDIHNIEADGDWGIPVFNDKISIDKLLSKLDSTRFLQIGDDGTLVFTINAELNDLLSVKNIINFPEKSFEKSGTISIPNAKNVHIDIPQLISINLNTNDFFLKSVSLNSGQIAFSFHITSIQVPYTITITAGNIIDAHGDSLSITLGHNQTEQIINLHNYSLRANSNGDIRFAAKLNLDLNNLDPSIIANLNSIDYHCKVTIRDFNIKNIIGQFNPISSNISKNIGFSLPINKLHIDGIAFSNPHLTILGKNSLCEASGVIQQLSFYNHLGQTSPIIHSEQNFSAPISPNNYVTLLEIQNTPINYNSNFDSIQLKSNVIINPNGPSAGDIYLNAASTLNLKAQMEIPANLSINNAIYNDTTNNALRTNIDASIINSIESLTLRVAFTNDLPFDVIPTITFLNTATHESFQLDLAGLQIHGAYNNIPNYQEPLFIEVNSAIAQNIVKSDKLVLHFSINTMGQQVSVKSSQFIHPTIGAKIKYSNITF